MRRLLICGNWKMQKSQVEMLSFFKLLAEKEVKGGVDYAIAPVSLHLNAAIAATADDAVKIVAQNMHFAENGAFTGEISADQLKEIACDRVILGHSERRAYYNESNESVAQKLETALRHQMTAVVCIGETLEQRENGQTFDVLTQQLTPVLEKMNAKNAEKVIFAYEPVWAIGTGKTASAEMAQEVHAFIRKLLEDALGEIAQNLSLLYGGSVKASNAEELLSQKDIDGALVGGASLDVESFYQLILIAESLSS